MSITDTLKNSIRSMDAPEGTMLIILIKPEYWELLVEENFHTKNLNRYSKFPEFLGIPVYRTPDLSGNYYNLIIVQNHGERT